MTVARLCTSLGVRRCCGGGGHGFHVVGARARFGQRQEIGSSSRRARKAGRFGVFDDRGRLQLRRRNVRLRFGHALRRRAYAPKHAVHRLLQMLHLFGQRNGITLRSLTYRSRTASSRSQTNRPTDGSIFHRFSARANSTSENRNSRKKTVGFQSLR